MATGEITRYEVVSHPDEKGDGPLFVTYRGEGGAEEYAAKSHGCVIEHTYVWDDDELIDDFRLQCYRCKVRDGDELPQGGPADIEPCVGCGGLDCLCTEAEINEAETTGEQLCQRCARKETKEAREELEEGRA